MRLLLHFAVLVFAVGVGRCGATVSFTVNYPTAVDGSPTQVDLFLAANNSTQVEVDGTAISLMSYTLRNETKSVMTSADAINLFSPYNFTVVVTKGRNSVLNMDGFRPLPHRSLGNDYTVSAWEPTVAGYSFVVVTAAVTSVSVTVEIPSYFLQEVTWAGTKYTNGDRFTISLKSKESAQLTFSDHDPTGVRLWTANGAAFSVLSGAMATPLNGTLPGNVYDVTPAADRLGSLYVGVPIPGRDLHVYRFVAVTNSTIAMFLVGRGRSGDDAAPLDKGRHYDFRANATTPTLIRSHNPGVVSLCIPSDESSPPAMASLYPTSQWHHSYLLTPLDPSGIMLEHVTITILASASSGVRMTSSNGVTTSVTGWTRFDAVFFVFNYVSVELTGVTSVWHVSNHSFQVVQSATNVGWAYSFSAGFDVGLEEPTTVAPTTTTTVPLTTTTTPTTVPLNTTTTPTSVTTSLPPVQTSSSTTSAIPTTLSSMLTSPWSTSTPSSSSLTSSSSLSTSTIRTSAGQASSSSSPVSSSTATTTSSASASVSSHSSGPTSNTTTNSTHIPAPSSSSSSSSSSISPNSTSPSSSYLPSWLDEAGEWIIVGCAVGGALLLVVSVVGAVLVLQKRARRRRPCSVSPHTSAPSTATCSSSSILVAGRRGPRILLEPGDLEHRLSAKPAMHTHLAWVSGGDLRGHRVTPSAPLRIARPSFSLHLPGDADYHRARGRGRMAPNDIA